jgi:acetyltransferase-like isoleucine patch superfamily enzyme
MHDYSLEDFTYAFFNATVSDGVTIERGSHVSADAIIISGFKVGECCEVGVRTEVINHISSHSKRVGNLDRIIY